MPTEATDTTYILLKDDNKIADVVSSVLDFQGYKIRRVHTQMRKAAGTFEQSERGRVPGGWNYKFDVTIAWLPDEHGAEVTVQVIEAKHNDQDSLNMARERCTELVLALLDAADLVVKSESECEKDTRYGSAAFASEAELRQQEFVCSKPDHRQLLLAPMGEEKLAVPVEYTTHHAIVCGPTGTGKSSGIFIPNIVERLGTSMIITESTLGKRMPYLFEKTAGWREKAGHKIYWFNPNDMTSTRINPIDMVRWAGEDEAVIEAESITNLLIKNSAGPQEAKEHPFWDRAEKHLLMSLVIHAAADDPNFGHLGAVRWHLLKGLPHLTPMMKNSPSFIAAMEYEGFLRNTTDEIRKGVITGLFNRLNPWLTPQVVALTAASDVTPQELQGSLFTFYLSAPTRRPDLQSLTILTLNYLIEMALKVQYKHDLTLLLDEFTNFGHIFGMEDLLSMIRKTGISAVLGFQGFAQLVERYGKTPAEIMLAQPGTLVFYKANRIEDAEVISKALDSQTFHDLQVNDLGRRNEHYSPRPLMRPGELMGLAKYEAVIFRPVGNPVRTFTFHWTDYKEATSNEPPSRSPHQVTEFIRQFGRVPLESTNEPKAEVREKEEVQEIDRKQELPERKGRTRNGGPDFFND